MPGLKSITLSDLILDLELGRVAWTPPATWYLALFTVAPNAGGTGGTEVAGNAYARIAISNDGTHWAAAANGQKANALAIDCGTPTPAGWGTIVAAALYDASSGGTMYRRFDANPAVAAAASVPFTIPVGGLLATEV